MGPRCLLSRSASDGRRKRPASARGGDRSRRDETRRDERKGERFLFARRPPRAVRTAGAKRTRRDDATICSGREETTRLSQTANFFFSGSANELRCVLYKSVSPISRFQHLIASPFNCPMNILYRTRLSSGKKLPSDRRVISARGFPPRSPAPPRRPHRRASPSP